MTRKAQILIVFLASTCALCGCTGRQKTPIVAAVEVLPTAFDAGWRGEAVCTRLFENAQIRTARCSFAPGVGHERHFHPPHWGYIEQGATMRITTATGTVDRELKSGTNWWSDGISWHEAVNIGTTTGVYVIVEPKQAK